MAYKSWKPKNNNYIDGAGIRVNRKTLLDYIFPVGSIYLTINETNPGTLFGGTWTRITGRFLLGTGVPDNNSNTYWGTDLTYNGTNKYSEALTSTGGSSRHNHTTQGYKLTINEMPRHTHSGITWGLNGRPFVYTGIGGNDATFDLAGPGIYSQNLNYGGTEHIYTAYEGGDQSHSHGDTGINYTMPPYYVVNMWRRTA